jgi:UDP-N-acetylglucosamine diphosphorylase / glucose-1-phosphate thymidylyltransferase / UDP-N-acetylgalactosamine diphosphorylase / glucosamine-1-phosphate N-acetyltransferase / galactosamine-1-phosphate N-acetyltransferase
MMPSLALQHWIEGFPASPLAPWATWQPWDFCSRSEFVVRELLVGLPAGEYHIDAGVAVHRSAKIESGATLKAPLVIGPRCLVAAGAYLRGGNWIASDCIFGPGAELKSSFVFAGTKLAHFNFVGDSMLGSGVNLEAGSIICNYRNERQDKTIHVRLDGRRHATESTKFGALVGDHCRVGANAVLAPGTLLAAGLVVPRLALVDQDITAAVT